MGTAKCTRCEGINPDGPGLCPDCRCENCKILRSRVAELEKAIVDFCTESDWATESWKRQPWIAPLFAIRNGLKKG